MNGYQPGELVRMLRVYGEEKFATRIVSAIVRERAKARITSTARLAELVKDAIPAAARRTGGNPAKRTFQALRIEVNGELAALESAVPAALDSLAPKGRLVVMCYQSLEDRIVKRALAARARSTGPIDLPVELPGTGPSLRLLTRGSEPPSAAEVAENPRAASVKLRAVERIDQQDQASGTARERPRMSTTHGGQGRLRPGEQPGGGGAMSERTIRAAVGGPDRGAGRHRGRREPAPGRRGTGGGPVAAGGRGTQPATAGADPGHGRAEARRRRSRACTRTAPRLRVAPPAPISAPRAPFIALVIALVIAGVLGILLINTKTNENSFQIEHAAGRADHAGQPAAAAGEPARRTTRASGNLDAAARRLGPGQGGTPACIRLPDGKVIGVPKPATASRP